MSRRRKTQEKRFIDCKNDAPLQKSENISEIIKNMKPCSVPLKRLNLQELANISLSVSTDSSTQLSVILEKHVKKEEEEKIARQHEIKQQREFELEKLRFDSTISSPLTVLIKIVPNFDIRDGNIVLFLILFERRAKRIGVDSCMFSYEGGRENRRDLKFVRIKCGQETLKAVIDTGAQISVVRADVVEG
ncbi:hypothetical protein TNCT_349911 [Trichonephila clavata]|uniref:Peptidase A2 domain-containing protein n=1 Tax=Trichonephila clavata TaxID=2740835 RepID=A0A8X6GAQ0_TRICU|nr:hypothetical protein TNCT_349911 [Trichonephila clavata]